MKSKQFVFLFVALLLFGMAVPVRAVSVAGNSSTKFTATYMAPKITVTVPATAEVFINPYQMPVVIDNKETDAQIVSTPVCIENKSEVPINVSVSATGKIKEGSNMRLVMTPTQGTTLTSKSAFVYFEIQAANSDDLDAVYWDDEYDATKHLVIRTYARTMKNIVALGAAGEEGCFGAFRLSGDCVARPKTAWTENDGIDVAISFTFTPLARF